MIIVGCDFHPSWQQVAVFDTETGEMMERKLVNGNGEAERFYRSLPVPSLIGLEACGNSQWFVELLQQLGHEVWVGDAAQIRASYVRKQKTDKRDAAHILKLLRGGTVSAAVGARDAEQRDLRQLLIHRHKLVEIRTRVKNGLQHLAMNRGMQKKRQAVDGGRAEGIARTTSGRLGGVPARGSAGVAERCSISQIGKLDEAAQRAADGARTGAVADDAAGGGADHRAGVRADHRRCRAVSSGASRWPAIWD